MKRLKVAGLLFVALCAMGLMVTSAFAATLPDIGLLPGESTGKAEATIPAKSTLENEAGATLEGTGGSVVILLTQLSSLQPYSSKFSNVVESKHTENKCKTGGEPGGTVLIGGEVHVVFLTTSPLTVGALFLVPTTKILCGPTASPEKVKITVSGSALSSYVGALNADTTTFKGALTGKDGVPGLSKYLNDSGTFSTSALRSDFGIEFEASNETIEKEPEFKAESGKMFIITG